MILPLPKLLTTFYPTDEKFFYLILKIVCFWGLEAFVTSLIMTRAHDKLDQSCLVRCSDHHLYQTGHW